MARNILVMNGELFRGDSIVSNNGLYKALFTEDGNFVVLSGEEKWKSISDSNGKDGMRLIMQADGNLVIYTTDNKPIWATMTNRADPGISCLTLSDDGNLMLFHRETVVWQSKSE